MNADYPVRLVLNKTSRNRLVAGMKSPSFIIKRPFDSETMNTATMEVEVTLMPIKDWTLVQKRLVKRLSGRDDLVMLLGELDVRALLAAVDCNPTGHRGMHASWGKIKTVAQECGVLEPDP